MSSEFCFKFLPIAGAASQLGPSLILRDSHEALLPYHEEVFMPLFYTFYMDM